MKKINKKIGKSYIIVFLNIDHEEREYLDPIMKLYKLNIRKIADELARILALKKCNSVTLEN